MPIFKKKKKVQGGKASIRTKLIYESDVPSIRKGI